MNKKEILKLLYRSNNYPKLKKLCKAKKDIWYKHILAKVYFFEKDYESSFEIYKSINMPYEAGYCKLLSGDINSAKKYWLQLEDESPIINWGKSLLGLIEKDVKLLPTYFQIRNFLEQDLDTLLDANLIDYAENLVNSADILAQVNSETYKYIARVLLNHGYIDIAKNFLEQSKEIYYKDPETHFLIAKINLQKKLDVEAKVSLKTTLEINPEYFPAKKLLEQIK